MSGAKVPEKWDDEADVIVVGGGNTGLPAAITAFDKGAKVIVLETSGGMASSLAMIAGGTPFTGTDLQKAEGIKDSPDQLYDEAVKVSGGDPELWRAICDRQEEVYRWLVSLGAKPEKVLMAPGHLLRRSIKFEGHGPALCKILRETVAKKKIDIRYKHRAQKLIVDPKTGRVGGDGTPDASGRWPQDGHGYRRGHGRPGPGGMPLHARRRRHADLRQLRSGGRHHRGQVGQAVRQRGH